MPSPRYARAWLAMLRELSRGRFDGPATTAGVAGSALACLERAIARVAAGDPEGAREDVERALSHSGAPQVQAAAGVVLQTTGDQARGLDLLEAACTAVGALPPDLCLRRAEYADRLGWTREAARALADAVEHDPENPRLRREHARSLAQAGALEAALEQLDHAARLGPMDATATLLQARVSIELGDAERARAAIARLAGLDDSDALTSAARMLIGLGRFADAGELLESAPMPDAEILALRGQMAGWAGDTASAMALHEAARTLDENAAATLHLGATLANEAGRIDDAARLLARAREDPAADVAVHLDHAQMLLRRGRRSQAHAALNRAAQLADPEHPVLQILRERVNLEQLEADEPVEPARLRPYLPFFRAALDRPEFTLADHSQETAKDAIDAVLAAVVWRGHSPIARGDKQPRTLWSPPRPSLAEIISRLPHVSWQEGRAIVGNFLATRPEHVDARCLRAELALRSGDLEAAAEDLDRALALAPESSRARLGLACLRLATGALEQAIELARAPVDPTDVTSVDLACVRAQAQRRLGLDVEARRGLCEVLRARPGNVAAWLELGLLELARDSSRAVSIHDWLANQCPALIADAQAIAGTEPGARDPRSMAAVFEHALEALGPLRGSAWITYRDAKGRERAVLEFPREDPAQPRRRRETLEYAQALVLEWTGLRSSLAPLRIEPPALPTTPMPSLDTAPTRAASPRIEPALGEAEIRQFVERGYVRLSSSFDRSTAEAIIARANARIASDPARWVRDYEPADAALARYRADDPATWIRSQIDLASERAFEFERFAPRLWSAIGQLLGGPERVETRAWHDHFSINFRDGAERGPTIPALDWRGWHVDDPSPRARLDEFSNALLLVMLFSDVDSGGGATFIVPESVGLVARRLAQHPDGVDLRAASFGPAVASECTERVELTGRVGDVFLCHAFMVHTASPNTSGRIRWMSNPMIQANEWLDYRGDPDVGSPVERTVRRALSGTPAHTPGH